MNERDLYFDDFPDNPLPVTLAATSTAVTVRRGVPFYVHNTGNAVMQIGHTAAKCTTPGIPIHPGQVRGPLTITRGTSIYMRGTALQTVVIEYGNVTYSDGIATLSAGSAVIGKVGSDITTRTHYNTTMTLADTEYSQALPANTKRAVVYIRDGDDTFNFRLAYATGKVATPTEPYMKFNGDIMYDTGVISLASGTLYFACNVAGQSVCLEVWS